MGRWRNIQKNAFPILLLALTTSVGLQAHSKDSVFAGKLLSAGKKIRFTNLPSKLLDERYSAVLEITVGPNGFNSRSIDVALNGVRPSLGPGEVSRYSHWKKGLYESTLVIEIGRMSFESKSFARRVAAITKQRGQFEVWVSGCNKRIRSAHLRFKDASYYQMPQLSWASRPPASFSGRDVEFSFKSSDASAKVECRMGSNPFVACHSPARYHGLTRGWHTFQARVIAANGKTGRGLDHRFYVYAIPPAVEIVKVAPSEDPTASTSIEFGLQKNWKIGGYGSQIQCRIDGGKFQPCGTKVHYKGLGSGEHTFEARLAVRLFIWWVYSGAESYTWTIEHNPLVAHWISTPASATKSTSAYFEVGANRVATFECSLDGAAASTCEAQSEWTGLSEGSHSLVVTAKDASGAISQPIEYRWNVDLTAPTVEIVSVNPQQNPTIMDSMAIAFTASEPSTLRCELDGVSSTCQSPFQASGLAEGSHRLVLEATDSVGNVGQSIFYEWIIDRTVPTVQITQTYPESLPTRQTSARFAVSSSEQSAFRCTLDEGPSYDCGTEVEVTGLGHGAHTLGVVALDAAGNESAMEQFQWTVDLIAPVLSFVGANPSENPTSSTSMDFQFALSEAAATSCEVDGGQAVLCSSPFVVNNLANGSHVLTVRAVDAAGNSALALTYDWVVHDVTAPVLTMHIVPAHSPTIQTSMTIEFSANEEASFLCELDGLGQSACASPTTWNGLALGNHTATVWAVDLAGNTSEPQTVTWEIVSEELTFTSVAVQAVTRDSAMVRWATRFPARGRVEYGVDGSFSESTPEVTPESINQSIVLTGLTRSTAYRARVVATDNEGRTTVSSEVTFNTLR